MRVPFPQEERIWPMCNANTVESEYYAIMSFQLYDDIREERFTCAMSCNDGFYHMSNNDKLIFIISDTNIIAKTARACQSFLYRRRLFMYNSY